MTARSPSLRSRARASARALAVSAAAIAVVLTTTAPAATQNERVRFTVRPANPSASDPRSVAWLIHRGKPGELIRDEVVVENLGDGGLRLELYPADAVTTGNGQFTLEPREAADDDVASWVHLARTRVTLGPDESAVVPFTVRVPDGATPGDHPGGIVARNLDPVSKGAVRTLLAVGARLYLRVPGPIVESLRVSDLRPAVDGGRVTFALDLENRGNTLIDVDAAYDLDAVLGGDVGREVGHVATLVPGARATITVAHPETLPGGPVDAAFTLRYGDGRETGAETGFFVFPPWPVLIAALLIVVSGVALPLGRRRARVRAATMGA